MIVIQHQEGPLPESPSPVLRRPMGRWLTLDFSAEPVSGPDLPADAVCGDLLGPGPNNLCSPLGVISKWHRLLTCERMSVLVSLLGPGPATCYATWWAGPSDRGGAWTWDGRLRQGPPQSLSWPRGGYTLKITS